MEKIRYMVERSPTSWLSQNELHDRLVLNNVFSVMYVSPINNNQGHIYHFNGECGGLTVKVIGVGEPRWAEIFGDRNKFNKAKLILEEALRTNLIEGKPA